MSAPVAPPSLRLEVSLRNLLLVAAPALAILLRWGLGWSTGAVTALVAPILAFSFALAPLVRWRARRFERELLRRIQLRQTDRLRGLYARQILLRLFASGTYLAARRGMIAQELGTHAEAREAFRAALVGGGEHPDLPLLLGLANACYALGDDAEAEPVYRQVLQQGGRFPNVFHNLAHGLLRRNLKLDEAIQLAEEGLEATGGSDALHLVLAELHAARGDKRRARTFADKVAPTRELEPRLEALGRRIESRS